MSSKGSGRECATTTGAGSGGQRPSPPLRETVVLVAGEGMTHAEAATALGVSESTISGRMHEVRRQADLAKDIGDED